MPARKRQIDYSDDDEEEKALEAELKTVKQPKTTAVKTAVKKKEDGGTEKPAKGGGRPWTAAEDAAILKSVHDLILLHQLDYSIVLPAVKAAGDGPERSKVAVRDRWQKMLKPQMLALTAGPKPSS